MGVVVVSKDNFEQEVLQSDVPVLVDFWATWCVPCRMVAPIVERIAERYAGRLKVAKLDVDENQELAIRYQVMAVPTLLLFKNGQVVDRIVGAVGEQAIVQKVETLLNQG
ncbi:MAG: hypothetical protein IMHGJWDQ_001303 [Candidatus Fervidibacter sp.]